MDLLSLHISYEEKLIQSSWIPLKHLLSGAIRSDRVAIRSDP
ncbi:hypothetical protein [uncultured Mediterranean phage uvMED]|nr:hypothetical protein [uncultured Mediterranean phage uvMED]